MDSKYQLSRRAVLTILIGGAGGAALIAGTTGLIPLSAEPAADRGEVTLYKNPQCDCCEGYAAYLRHNGFKVTAVSTNDLTAIGQKYGIPDDLAPCHISLIGGYGRSRRSPGSRCQGCPRARLECPVRSPACCRFTRSGRVRPRSMRPSNRHAKME